MNKSIKRKEDVNQIRQPNIISQAIYDLSPSARKLVAMAMSLLPAEGGSSWDYDNNIVSFKTADFINALGLDRGGETRKYIKAAVEECHNSSVTIEIPNEGFDIMSWFTISKIRENTITMAFTPEMADLLRSFKKAYAKISLVDLGKLQSRYAIRFYELAMSYSGFAGKDGNPRGHWWFEKTLDDLRILFNVKKRLYPRTGNFRTFVIDNPIDEINKADIGIFIEPEYVYNGRFLIGARFKCRWMARDEPRPTQSATETGQESDLLREVFPEEFEKIKAEAWVELKKSPTLAFYGNDAVMQERHAESLAYEHLKKLHPDFFKKPKRKTGKNRIGSAPRNGNTP